jgi:hypothetical protein
MAIRSYEFSFRRNAMKDAREYEDALEKAVK